MAAKLTEEEVHQHLYKVGLEAVILDDPTFDRDGTSEEQIDDDGDLGFELWRLIKSRTLAKIHRLHQAVRYGSFVGSKIKLPIDSTRPGTVSVWFCSRLDAKRAIPMSSSRRGERLRNHSLARRYATRALGTETRRPFLVRY